MKPFFALIFLAAISLAAGFDFKNLKPRDIVMPVNPRHTAQEWREIYAAQVPSPEIDPSYKKGTERQPVFAGKVHVPLNEQANRITGGSFAARGQFPWQVALIIDVSFFCGGSLISSLWVLTAAHCAGSSYHIVLGANRYDASEPESLMVVSTYHIANSGYNPSTIENDIAVVRLPSTVNFNDYISPVKLHIILGDLAGASVRVSGWGKTSDSSSAISPSLSFVDLTVITNTQCANTFGSIITPTKLCCATAGGKSTCDGDSGGPLLYQEDDGTYIQVGIVSFGAAAGCQLGYPVGFTRVSSFLSWISENTGISID